MALNSGLQESKLPLSQCSMFVETETTSTVGFRLLLLQVPELWLVSSRQLKPKYVTVVTDACEYLRIASPAVMCSLVGDAQSLERNATQIPIALRSKFLMEENTDDDR